MPNDRASEQYHSDDFVKPACLQGSHRVARHMKYTWSLFTNVHIYNYIFQCRVKCSVILLVLCTCTSFTEHQTDVAIGPTPQCAQTIVQAYYLSATLISLSRRGLQSKAYKGTHIPLREGLAGVVRLRRATCRCRHLPLELWRGAGLGGTVLRPAQAALRRRARRLRLRLSLRRLVTWVYDKQKKIISTISKGNDTFWKILFKYYRISNFIVKLKESDTNKLLRSGLIVITQISHIIAYLKICQSNSNFSFKTPWDKTKLIKSGFLVITQLSCIIAH